MFVKNKILGRKKTVQKETFQFLLDVLSIPQNKIISLSAFQFKDLYCIDYTEVPRQVNSKMTGNIDFVKSWTDYVASGYQGRRPES